MRAALVYLRMTTSAYFVNTSSRLAQWRVDNIPTNTHFGSSSDRNSLKSSPFRIGKWDWSLFVNKSPNLAIKLYPLSLGEDSTLVASFNIRVISYLDGRKTFNHPGYATEKVNKGFVWELEVPLSGKFIVDIQFVDLKIASVTGGESHSIWNIGCTQKDMNSLRLSSFAKMLSESIHTDITICASDGSIGAHRAVLAASSPVFRSMFSHDLKEKEMSTINISDMSIEVCTAFLNYIYSNLTYQDLFNHRLDLLIAADKYDISDLKDKCEESLTEDIDTKNVLGRLQSSSMYRLPKLKLCCIQYLVNFGKIFDIMEEFDAFAKYADRELIYEVFKEILSIGKGF